MRRVLPVVELFFVGNNRIAGQKAIPNGHRIAIPWGHE